MVKIDPKYFNFVTLTHSLIHLEYLDLFQTHLCLFWSIWSILDPFEITGLVNMVKGNFKQTQLFSEQTEWQHWESNSQPHIMHNSELAGWLIPIQHIQWKCPNQHNDLTLHKITIGSITHWWQTYLSYVNNIYVCCYVTISFIALFTSNWCPIQLWIHHL